jgi:segregation and condensation protein B
MTAHSADLRRLLRALLLAADQPLTTEQVAALIERAVDEEEWPAAVDASAVQAAFVALAASLEGSGTELVEVAEGWRLRTAPDLAAMVRRLWPDRIQRLSKAALEAVSIIAYRQPVTRAEVEAVRGVDSGGVLRSLMDRGLLRIIGRKDEPGRPLLYGTTQAFLETFSLPNLRALPTLRDLESLRQEEAARARGEIPET